jgi:AmmeMemoRadiSam system protein A
VIDPAPGPPLTPPEAEFLLGLARRAVRAAVDGDTLAEDADGPALLETRRDVFVTLRIEGELRGCLGTYGAPRTLRANLLQAARGAACEDPRFPPVERAEIHALRIELTLLDPPFAIAGPEGIVVGRHGLSVRHREARGLLLPQVAIEHRLDALAFLELTCRKAGLRPDAWRNGARIEAFTAQCVSEPAPAAGRADARRD